MNKKYNYPSSQVMLALATLAAVSPAHAESVPETSGAGADPNSDSSQQRSAETKSKLTRAPALIKFVPAELAAEHLPAEAARAVLLTLTVTEQGDVTNVVVTQSASPELDAAAVRAVKQFRFRPAEVDHQPAAVRIQYRYVFEGAVADAAEERESSAALPQATIATAQAEASGSELSPAVVKRGRLAGQLLERDSGKPLAGANVRLPELGLEILTDAEGRFVFESIPEGDVAIELSDPGYERVTDQERVLAGKVTEVRYTLTPSGAASDELVAVGRRPQKEVVRRTLSVKEIESVPGTNGDALKAIQNLPGAARIPFGLGDIVLRGGGRSHVYVNGHSIPNAFHFGGLRSSVGNGLLKDVAVYPGNYGSRYGRSTGGMVELQLRRPATDGLHGYGQIDLFDASLFLEGPLGSHGSFAVGARRSYIDVVLGSAKDDNGKPLFDAAPRYYDFQAAYDWQKGEHQVGVNVLGSGDKMVLLLEEPDESDPLVRDDFDFASQWFTSQAYWDVQINEQQQNRVSVSYLRGSERQKLGRDFSLDFAYDSVSLRNDYSADLNSWLSFRAGLDLELQRVDFDVTAPQPVKEGEPEVPLSAQHFLRDQGSATQTSPGVWTELDVQLGELLLVPGVRVDHYSPLNRLGGEAVVQPRLSARWSFGTATVLKGGVGRYSASGDIDELNDVFGNPDLGPETSTQYSLGFEQHLGAALSLDVTGFYKSISDKIAAVADPAVKYANAGRARAYGVETLLKHDQQGRFFGWLAYTLSRSERKDAETEPYRVFDLDQTHNLAVVGKVRLGESWELGGRFRYVTGNPITPYAGAVYDSDADTYLPQFGATNSDRSDAFHQLDIRLDKHWQFDSWRLTSYLDLQNVYNRENPEGLSANFDYSETKPQGGLPFIPSFGVKGEF